MGRFDRSRGRERYIHHRPEWSRQNYHAQHHRRGTTSKKGAGLLRWPGHHQAPSSRARQVADEPGPRRPATLARKIVDEIFRLVRDIAAKGVTILLVGQNVNYTLQVSDYGYVMDLGRIVLEGPAHQLLNDEHVRQTYLGVAEDH